ncbi:hypothetical protein NQ318_000668 [Aromia moschata]|uniref:Uncharacterized protein n=1 Tax=Aromia moschata TaxID=1265417 RepID=A0AAV8Y3I7_9CUCU|nr:hypothetical protein NQ318_000668 [Aromia moschata]
MNLHLHFTTMLIAKTVVTVREKILTGLGNYTRKTLRKSITPQMLTDVRRLFTCRMLPKFWRHAF